MDEIAIYQKGMEENVNGLRDGLELTFTSLHQAIAERDSDLIGSMCEQNLRFALFEFFDALDEEDC